MTWTDVGRWTLFVAFLAAVALLGVITCILFLLWQMIRLVLAVMHR